jgi:hypothetical protein
LGWIPLCNWIRRSVGSRDRNILVGKGDWEISNPWVGGRAVLSEKNPSRLRPQHLIHQQLTTGNKQLPLRSFYAALILFSPSA